MKPIPVSDYTVTKEYGQNDMRQVTFRAEFTVVLTGLDLVEGGSIKDAVERWYRPQLEAYGVTHDDEELGGVVHVDWDSIISIAD